MQADIVESLSTNLLVTFQAIVNQIVKENNLESVSENRDDEKMNCVIRQFVKMQSQLTASFDTGNQKMAIMLPEFK